MFRNLLLRGGFAALAISGSVGACGTSFAADLPVKEAPPVERMCDYGRMAGFYVGGNGGYINHRTLRTDSDGLLGEAATLAAEKGGPEAGAQVGYNWQRHCTVFGIEADWQWANAQAGGQMIPNTPGVNFSFNSNMRWFSTVRARAGFMIDSTLLYATAGAAFANVQDTWNVIDPLGLVAPGPVAFSNTFSNTRVGVAVGLGAEFAWTQNISIKAEALYLAFPDQSNTFPAPPVLGLNPANLATIRGSDSAVVARLGVNWRFGGPVF